MQAVDEGKDLGHLCVHLTGSFTSVRELCDSVAVCDGKLVLGLL